MSKENILSSAASMLRGRQTVVIGSGYAALDAARMAARLSQEVQIVFGGLEEEMEVSGDKLKEAIEEGVKIQAPYEPLKIVNDGQGASKAVACHRMGIIEGNGRLNLELAQEEPTLLPAQTVILANGQKPNPFLSRMTTLLKVQDNGALWIDEDTSKTSLEKVFAVASAVKGPISVVEAFAQGKKVAGQITEHFKQ